MSRRDLALRMPDETAYDFKGFPRKTLRAGSRWFRQHQQRSEPDHGAWYFASYPSGTEGAGRFDLESPSGTCYLSTTASGAVNELIGPEYVDRGWVDSSLVAGRVLSQLSLPAEVKAADTTSARAGLFRATNELATTDRYDISQAWAAVLQRAGFGGVHAALRFTQGPTRGLALYGQAGVPKSLPPGDPAPRPVREVVEEMSIEVVDPPRHSAVRIVTP